MAARIPQSCIPENRPALDFMAHAPKSYRVNKSYWYIVCFDNGRATGVIPSPNQSWAHDGREEYEASAPGREAMMIRGRDVHEYRAINGIS
ncbi:hypothetical protein LCGC14_3008200 [marine sediment metagenome]|uniref:Uncharacterized protein n=1 Tax=marine sediment metagenome TaxID=412755 RepID=A0A0F8WYV9_9ZZZZ